MDPAEESSKWERMTNDERDFSIVCRARHAAGRKVELGGTWGNLGGQSSSSSSMTSGTSTAKTEAFFAPHPVILVPGSTLPAEFRAPE